MIQNPWWGRAAWISAFVAAVLTIDASANAFRSGGDALVLITAATVAGNAAIWWVASAGFRQFRRWSLHLGGAAGSFNFAVGLMASLNPRAAADAVAETGMRVQNSPLSAALGWAPVVGSGLVLVALVMIALGVRRTRRLSPA